MPRTAFSAGQAGRTSSGSAKLPSAAFSNKMASRLRTSGDRLLESVPTASRRACALLASVLSSVTRARPVSISRFTDGSCSSPLRCFNNAALASSIERRISRTALSRTVESVFERSDILCGDAERLAETVVRADLGHVVASGGARWSLGHGINERHRGRGLIC